MAEKNTIVITKEFPFINDEYILHLKLNVLYRILGSVKATDKEVELIKKMRRRLQKFDFKQRKECFLQSLTEDLRQLEMEKNSLLKIRTELEMEITEYKLQLLQDF